MRETLLNYLKCPNCGQSIFKLETDARDEIEIREGEVICSGCLFRFQIKKGIVYLFSKLSNEAEAEIKALKSEILEINLNFQSKQWLLDFPNNARLGVDDRAERITRLNSENILLGLGEMIQGEGQSILEIGAGNCWVTARLAEKHKCIALDIFTDYPKGLEAGEIFIRERGVYFERLMADMFDLPFKDGGFDIIFISSTLHHSQDLVKTLEGVNRILKKDGKICLLNEPVQGFFGRDRQNIKVEREKGFNEKRYSLKSWKRAFFESGFDATILLPANLLSVVALRSRSAYYILLILSKLRVKKLVKLMTFIIFTVSDGFFNAVLRKKL